MMVLYLLLLMIGPSMAAEPSRERVIYKESGDNITVTCSYVGCLQSPANYAGMYLYHDFITQEEVLYSSKIMTFQRGAAVRKRYSGRVHTSHSFANLSITISNVMVDDSGFYKCVYKKDLRMSSTCQVYIVVIKGNSSCPRTTDVDKTSHPLVLVVVLASLSTLIITLILVFISLKLKQCEKGRKQRRVEAQLSGVYEVMTKREFQRVDAPARS